MEYDFLYDHARHLLAIGYNVGERRRDPSYYDLLASEARFASFVAIAQGQLPQENWFALGRLLTTRGRATVLLSWSGSMFEYLMPLLVMPTYENTLLDQTCRATVERQIAYGKQRGVPWGISECGYNAVDASLNYQYRAFGVPGLGLKRGLAEDLVIAPYASALALMVAPEAACRNLQRLAADGLAGRFGLYEAIDYTPARLPRGQTSAVVRSFMAHHQGMILLSLAHLLLARPMQKRFESDPQFKATLLLLQERIPKVAAVFPHPRRAVRDRREFRRRRRRRCACSRVPTRRYRKCSCCRTAATTSWSRTPAAAAAAGRTSPSPAGAKTPPATTGARSATSATSRAGSSGRPRTSRRASAPSTTRRYSPKRAPNSAGATTTSKRIPRSSFRRKTTSSCAGCASPTARGRGATIDVTSYAEVVARVAGRGRAASGVLQSVRADRDHRAAAGHPVHAPAALARRAAAVDVPPDGRARRRSRWTFPTRPTAWRSSAAGARWPRRRR